MSTQPEVIQAWGDSPGNEEWTFVRSKMEHYVRSFCGGDKPSLLPAELVKKLQGGAASVPGFQGKIKREDVDFVVS